MRIRRVRIMTAWMACLAILLSALAPAISHAMRSPDVLERALAEICTVEGVKMVDTGVPDKSRNADHDMHLEDCPYCRASSMTPGLLPTEWQWLPSPQGKAVRPRLFYESTTLRFTWQPPQSRAPPALS